MKIFEAFLYEMRQIWGIFGSFIDLQKTKKVKKENIKKEDV